VPSTFISNIGILQIFIILCRYEYNMQQLASIFAFYKSYFIGSIIINMLLIFMNMNILIILFLKLLMVFFLWFYMNETGGSRKLLFYKNLGISSFKLYAAFYMIDLAISIPFLLIMNTFI
jgi:hypothetical protein